MTSTRSRRCSQRRDRHSFWSRAQDPDQATFDALVELAELLAIPVIDAPARLLEFPEVARPLSRLDINPYLAEMDFALLVENRAPWYPPSNVPKNAKIVAIGKQPAQGHNGLPGHGATQYLEGDTALDASLLTQALRQLRSSMPPRWRIAAPAGRPSTRACAGARCRRRKASSADHHHGAALAKVLREVIRRMPVYVDETIVHARLDPRAHDVGRAVGLLSRAERIRTGARLCAGRQARNAEAPSGGHDRRRDVALQSRHTGAGVRRRAQAAAADPGVQQCEIRRRCSTSTRSSIRPAPRSRPKDYYGVD